MSSIKKYSLIICCTSLFGLGVGGLLYYYTDHGFERNPASALPAPQMKKGPWLSENVVGKPQRTMDITIQAMHGIPSTNNQEIVLRADVRLLQSLGQNIEYKWILPADAVVVEGNLDDVWQNLNPGQTASVEISLLNVSRETPKTVVFQAFGLVDGVRMGGTAAFSTAATSATSEEEVTTAQKVEINEKSKQQSEALKRVQQ